MAGYTLCRSYVSVASHFRQRLSLPLFAHTEAVHWGGGLSLANMDCPSDPNKFKRLPRRHAIVMNCHAFGNGKWEVCRRVLFFCGSSAPVRALPNSRAPVLCRPVEPRWRSRFRTWSCSSSASGTRASRPAGRRPDTNPTPLDPRARNLTAPSPGAKPKLRSAPPALLSERILTSRFSRINVQGDTLEVSKPSASPLRMITAM